MVAGLFLTCTAVIAGVWYYMYAEIRACRLSANSAGALLARDTRRTARS